MKYVIDAVPDGTITVIPEPDTERPERDRVALEVNVGGHDGVSLFLALDKNGKDELVRAMDMAMGTASSFPIPYPPGVR